MFLQLSQNLINKYKSKLLGAWIYFNSNTMNTIPQKYITYKHLYISGNENHVIFLGYELSLTKTEYLVLKTLVKSNNSPISAEQIASQTELELSKENVSFHISSINRKAKLISNRILVKNIAKIGYFLNEEM